MLKDAISSLASVFKILIGVIFGISLISTLWIAYFVPVYADEPQWKLISARIFLDDGFLVYLFPVCQDNFLLKSPWTWYPARWLDALLYADASNPAFLRATGWAVFSLLILIWSWIFQRVSKIHFYSCFLFVASFFSVGVLPFLMVFNRPEQSVLICITSAILLMLWLEDKRQNNALMEIFYTICIGLLSCLMVASHPKGLYLLPALFIIWYKVVKKWYLGTVLLGVMLWTSIETIQFWQSRTNCQESPWLTKVLTTLSIPPSQALNNFSGFWHSGLANLTDWKTYVNRIGFQVDYQGNWLPSSGQPELFKAYQQFFLYVPILVFLVFCTMQLFAAIREKNFSKILLPISLLLGLIGFAFMQTNKNFYEAGFVWPLLLLILILGISKSAQIEKKFFIYLALPFLVIISIYSGYERYELFAKNVVHWQKARLDYIHETSSLKIFAKEKCNIQNDTKNLMLDDATYPIFWQNSQPMLAPYIFGWWATGTSYYEILSKRKSGGAVMRCDGFLPKQFMDRTQRQGNYCCLSGSEINEILLRQD